MNCSFVAIALAATLASAQAAGPNLSEQFYQAIRTDSSRALGQLLSSGADVNVKDSRGTTPLMYAAAVGTSRMMRQLIDAGADVNARNSFDATALMWCTQDMDKVRLLIEKGADVNARSKQGRTPVLIAAGHDGNSAIVRLLLEHGANLAEARDSKKSSPLLEAALYDAATVDLLLKKGDQVNARNAGGLTPLMQAAGTGNVGVVKRLIAQGADVNAQSEPSLGHQVRHGPIALGSLTPLMLAVTSGSAETVRILLNAGAAVNVKDVRGMTPLMLAVATDHPDEKIVRMLLDKGADTRVKSNIGETPLAWAAKFRNPSILAAIKAASAGIEVPNAKPAASQPCEDSVSEKAVEKSIDLLQKASRTFFQQSGCIACHSQNITSMAVAAARSKGIRTDAAMASEFLRGTRLQYSARAEAMLERVDPPAVDILTYTLFALSVENAEPDRVTDAMIHNLAAQQRADGSWGTGGIVRPPTADGGFSVVAMAIRALRDYAPPARKPEMERRMAKAAKWLLDAQPRTTEDAVMQLLGAKWAGISTETIAGLERKIRSLQREDGGWGQTPYLQSDAYATGTAMYALHEAGVTATSDPAYQRGMRYLVQTQSADGAWYVASRAPKFQPYFDGGFPYGHDQWISQMATGWASMALSFGMPDHRAAR